MAVDERARHHLFLRVEEELGPEAAETMMQLLPPVGWADVATKEDLRRLEERMALRFEVIRTEMESMESRIEGEMHQAMNAQFRNLMVLCTGLVVSVGGIAFAAVGLA